MTPIRRRVPHGTNQKIGIEELNHMIGTALAATATAAAVVHGGVVMQFLDDVSNGGIVPVDHGGRPPIRWRARSDQAPEGVVIDAPIYGGQRRERIVQTPGHLPVFVVEPSKRIRPIAVDFKTFPRRPLSNRYDQSLTPVVGNHGAHCVRCDLVGHSEIVILNGNIHSLSDIDGFCQALGHIPGMTRSYNTDDDVR